MRAQFDAAGFVLAVTGGANGIGRALALAVAGAGGRVAVLDRDESALDSLGGTDGIMPLSVDMADRAAIGRAFERIGTELGPVDGLLCGAAIQPRTPVHRMDPEEWRQVMAVNLDAVVWCYQAVAPQMIARRRGVILAFTSGLAHQGWPGASAYAASKAALIAFGKSAAKELAPHRVRFNLVSPGVIDTAQYRAANAGADDAAWKATLGVGQPEDVVGPLMFLLSDAATMTGSILARDMAYPGGDDGGDA